MNVAMMIAERCISTLRCSTYNSCSAKREVVVISRNLNCQQREWEEIENNASSHRLLDIAASPKCSQG
jgi:hypothetical protein